MHLIDDDDDFPLDDVTDIEGEFEKFPVDEEEEVVSGPCVIDLVLDEDEEDVGRN